MSQSEAELTLLINAKNLAAGVVNNFGKSLDGVGKAAGQMATKVGNAFRAVSNGVVNGLGNLTETLAQGGGLGPAAFAFGAYMAGQAAEALLENLIEKLAESTLVEALGAALTTLGSALGSFLSTAIAIGAAAFPVVLAALIVGAIIFLINNPEIVNKIGEFAGGVVDFIIKGIGQLPQLLLTAISAAVKFVTDNIWPFIQKIVDLWLSIPGKLIGLGLAIVTTIVNGLVSLPGKIADVVREAFARLDIRVGPFHITGKGITVELPNITVPAGQGGNVVGNAINMPTRAPTGGAGTGVRIEGVSARELDDVIDRALFVRLRRAAPSLGPG